MTTVLHNPREFLFVEKYRPQTLDDCILPERILKPFREMVKKGEIINTLLVGTGGVGKCLHGSETVEIFADKELIMQMKEFIRSREQNISFQDFYERYKADFLRFGVFTSDIPDNHINYDTIRKIMAMSKQKPWCERTIESIFQKLPPRNTLARAWLMGVPYDYYLNRKIYGKRYPSTYDWRLVANINPDTGYQIMRNFYDNRLPVKMCSNIYDKQYWTDRGWSESDAIAKIEERHDMCARWRPAYWEMRGYTHEEAVAKISDKQRRLCYVGLEKSPCINRLTSVKLDYWLKQTNGDVDLAMKLLHERQSTFTKEKCIARYGEAEGLKVWQARQDKWQKTLQSREDIDEINARKDSVSYQFHQRVYGDNADIEHYKRLQQISRLNYSAESLKYFDKLIEWANNEGLPCLYGDEEFSLYSSETKSIKHYDLTFPSLKLIIDYHGYAFHPRDGDINFMSPYGTTYHEQYAQDIDQRKTAEQEGFEYVVVWSDDLPSIESLIERAKCKVVK